MKQLVAWQALPQQLQPRLKNGAGAGAPGTHAGMEAFGSFNGSDEHERHHMKTFPDLSQRPIWHGVAAVTSSITALPSSRKRQSQ